jgi:hypothetical protein
MGNEIVLVFEFDETAGNSFADSSGYGHTATATASGVAAGSPGHTGMAVAFSGGAITVPAPTRIPDSSQIWIEAWIQPAAPLDRTRTIATKVGSYTLKQVNTDLQLSLQPSALSNPCIVTTSNLGLSPGNWYHIAGWYDGLAVSVAVNGAVKAAATCPGGSVASSAGGPFHVGGIPNGNQVAEDYAGKIDELRVRRHAAQAYTASLLPYVSPWRWIMNDSQFHTFTHGFGTVPSQCIAYWSPNANGNPKRPVGDFMDQCRVGGATTFRGMEMVMDANTVSLSAITGGHAFCYYDGTWRPVNAAYVQVICQR